MGVVFPLMIKVLDSISPSFFVILMWLGKSSSCLTRIWYFGNKKVYNYSRQTVVFSRILLTKEVCNFLVKSNVVRKKVDFGILGTKK